MQDQREMMSGGIPDDATDAERQALEREWDEMDRERDDLIESWKDMYRRQGLDPEHVHLNWDAVFHLTARAPCDYTQARYRHT